MSEVKFACPVCGQHITTDSSTIGSKLQCPTCYRKIVVPQVSAVADSKLVLSAAEADKPRPTHAVESLGPIRRSPNSSMWGTVVLLFIAVGLVGSIYFFRETIFGRTRLDNSANNLQPVDGVRSIYPVPTNFAWSLNLKNESFPESGAAGRIHGAGFLCQKVTLQGGNLTLRQGQNWPPDLGVSISFFAKQGEELSGKYIEVTPDRPAPIPRVVLRWKDESGRQVTETIHAGYALKVQFREVVAGRIDGKIYLCLPDQPKSFVAGSFDAEIRKPAPPRPKQPKVAAKP
jgi:hypothetical protein